MRPLVPHGEVAHHTFYETRSLAIRAKARICTIYDMIPRGSQSSSRRNSACWAPADSSTSAMGTPCISETIKEDLESYYGAVDKPIFVTPLGVEQLLSRWCHPGRMTPHTCSMWVSVAATRTSGHSFEPLREWPRRPWT